MKILFYVRIILVLPSDVGSLLNKIYLVFLFIIKYENFILTATSSVWQLLL